MIVWLSYIQINLKELISQELKKEQIFLQLKNVLYSTKV